MNQQKDVPILRACLLQPLTCASTASDFKSPEVPVLTVLMCPVANAGALRCRHAACLELLPLRDPMRCPWESEVLAGMCSCSGLRMTSRKQPNFSGATWQHPSADRVLEASPSL